MEQQKPIDPEDTKWTYRLEPDLRVVAKVNRLTQAMVFIVLASLLTGICFAWRVDPPAGFRPPLILVAAAWIAGMGIASLAFRTRGPMKESQVWIGADFLAATVPGTSRGLAIVRYDDIRTVILRVSKGHIVGADVRAKGFQALSIHHVKNPAIAVRAIFDHAPQQVKWRRQRFPYTRVTRDEIAALIADANLPPADTMLPPGCTLGRRDEVFPPPDKSRKRSDGTFRAVTERSDPPPEESR